MNIVVAGFTDRDETLFDLLPGKRFLVFLIFVPRPGNQMMPIHHAYIATAQVTFVHPPLTSLMPRLTDCDDVS